MTLEDIVEKLFTEHPDLKEDEAVKKLREMKDPKTNRSLWKAATIRNRVDTYFRKKRDASDTSIETPVETKGSGSGLEIEGKRIERHRPKDPFAIESEVNVEEKVDQMEGREKLVDKSKKGFPEQDAEQFKKGIAYDVSREVLEQVSAETKSFKEEAISIIGDLKSSMIDTITDLKKEMIDMQARILPTYEATERYDDLELKQSTIKAIQKNTEEAELKEESDYIDNLIKSEKEYTSISQTYYKLVNLAKEAKKGVQLRLFYENDKLSYDKKHVRRFGISPKNLAAGILIGIAIGIAIVSIYTTLMTLLPAPAP